MHEAIAWVRANAMPLASVEAGHGFADLEPLRAHHRQRAHRLARRGHARHARVLPAQAPPARVLRRPSSASRSSASRRASPSAAHQRLRARTARAIPPRRWPAALLDLEHRGGARADRVDARLEPHARAQGEVLRLRHAVPDRGRAWRARLPEARGARPRRRQRRAALAALRRRLGRSVPPASHRDPRCSARGIEPSSTPSAARDWPGSRRAARSSGSSPA